MQIRAGNITCGAGSPSGLPTPPSCTQGGIYIRGHCLAPIVVDWDVLFANLVAGSFEKPIVIGRFMKGAIAAVGGTDSNSDPITGFIGSIQIGYSDLVPEMGTPYSQYGIGLSGIDRATPFTPITLEQWLTEPGADGGAIDGVIRAKDYIDTCDVRVLGLDYLVGGGGCKHLAPRVEAPAINFLHIPDFRVGSIWSGDLAATDFDGFYSSIGSMLVGCVGPLADVWMKDFASAIVTNNLLGEIHVPSIPADRTLFVGGRLGDVAAPPFTEDGVLSSIACECWQFDETWACEFCSPWDILESSPRNPYYSNSFCTGQNRGNIWVHDTQALAGQVIINGSNIDEDASLLWSGEADVGLEPNTSTCPHVQIAPYQPYSTNFRAPYYSKPSGTVGGGAVGLVPFAQYADDCTPVHYDDWNWFYDHDQTHWAEWAGPGIAGSPPSANRLLNSTFCLPQGDPEKQVAVCRFYGPVWTDAPDPGSGSTTRQPCQVWEYVEVAPQHQYVWLNVTNAVDIDIARSPGQARREVTISWKGSTVAQADYFALMINVTPPVNQSKPFAAYCGGPSGDWVPLRPNAYGLDAAGRTIPAVQYNFRLYPDCNGDHEVDDADVKCPLISGYCYADLTDATTTFDGSSGNCGFPNGGVDVDDLVFFLAAFEAGSTCVDFTDNTGDGAPDGGVDINDLLFFLIHFEAGC